MEWYLEHLTILNLSSCKFLKTAIDFTGLLCLNKLFLGGCDSLEEIHPSIGQLGRLVYLNLSRCINLRILPSNICNLRALEILNINYCKKMKELPKEIGNIRSLTHLSGSFTRISEILDFIGRLSKLVYLDFTFCSDLRILTSKLCNLKTLENLDLYGCSKLEGLAEKLGNICNLRALQKLDIDGCTNLEGLPEELGKLENLRELNGGGIKLNKIPDFVGDMKNLRALLLASPGRVDI